MAQHRYFRLRDHLFEGTEPPWLIRVSPNGESFYIPGKGEIKNVSKTWTLEKCLEEVATLYWTECDINLEPIVTPISDGQTSIIDSNAAENTMSQYFDKSGRQISREQWLKLSSDLGYKVIKEFENERIYARVEWYGHVTNSAVPPEHRKLFRLMVQNIVTTDENGLPLAQPQRVHDPEASDSYRTEKEAVAVYEDLLVRYADCEWVTSPAGNEHFIEKGNVLAPPPPDAPSRTEDEELQEIAGSW